MRLYKQNEKRKQYCTTDQQVSKGCRYASHVDHDSVTVKKKKQTNEGFITPFRKTCLKGGGAGGERGGGA